MPSIDNRTSEIRIDKTTFIVLSHFQEQAGETIDQKIAHLICKSSENLIVTPIN